MEDGKRQFRAFLATCPPHLAPEPNRVQIREVVIEASCPVQAMQIAALRLTELCIKKWRPYLQMSSRPYVVDVVPE